MKIDAMMLFGSAARGENTPSSDIDILAVTEDDAPFRRNFGAAEMQFLPKSELFSMSERGDIFAIHLALEGVVVFDVSGVFSEFKEKLCIKESYEDQRLMASELAWFILDMGPVFNNQFLINKRIAWCIRTMLISKLVERGRFVFSPHGIARAFDDVDVCALIELRRSKSMDEGRFVQLRRFIDKYGSPRPGVADIDEYKELFLKSRNSVALSTISALFKDDTNVVEYS
jgi:hypothetical protein